MPRWAVQQIISRPFDTPEQEARVRRKPEKFHGIVTYERKKRKAQVQDPQHENLNSEVVFIEEIPRHDVFGENLKKITQLVGALEVKEKTMESLAFLKDCHVEVSGNLERELDAAIEFYLNDSVESADYVEEVDESADFHITKKSLKEATCPSAWLNDKVILQYFDLLQKDYKNFFFFHPMALHYMVIEFPSIKESLVKAFHLEKLEELMKNAEKIFFAILHKSHWFPMIVHVTEKEIYIVDPLQNDTTFYDGIMHLLVWILNKFLNKDWSWTFYLVNHNSRQKDASSCGVYTLKFIQCWAMGRRPNITKSTHARIARKFMALEIAMSKLADPFNYASFLNENKLGKETEVQGVQTERPLARITRAASRKASNSKLLILDLNGVILAKNSNDRYDFKFRPYTHEFLKFYFSCFNVAIWSSKQWHNVQRVIKNLPHFKWEFVWNQAHCTVVETKTKENPEKKIMFKDLRKVWKDFEQYGLSNTLLVDDSPYKSFLNPRYNAIFPESYAFSSEKDNYLDPKGEFAQHLKKLAEADNVEEFIKQNPFGQPPIIEESDEWHFYMKALNES